MKKGNQVIGSDTLSEQKQWIGHFSGIAGLSFSPFIIRAYPRHP
jgi:hypothetical protein